jgi:VWFA-related protein
MAGYPSGDRGANAAIVVAAFALAFTALAAQSTPPGSSPQLPQSDPQRPPPIRTGAELVRVDATVLDKKGQPVPELTADDFDVQEDDVPQAIQSFKFVSVNGYPEQGDELSLPIRSRGHAAAEASRDDVRVFLIFWDEYHVSRMASAMRARENLTRFVRSAFGPKDLVAFMDPLTPVDAIRFTRDRLELAEKVRTLQGRLGVYAPARSLVEEAHMHSREGVERLRSQVTLTALKSAAVYLGTLREGRKSIIFISEGMRDLGRDEPRMIDDVIRAANDSNTGIYTLNPQGLTVSRLARFDMLQALANETGAEAFLTNDLERALRRVVTQASAYYLLGYSPSQRALDGKFHRIKVRVKREGLEVRARSGYWAPTLSDMQRASKAAADTLPIPVARALAELTPAGSRNSVDLWIGTALGSSGQPQVRLVWAPRASEPGEEADVTAASALAKSEGGAVFDGEVERQGIVFDAPPGALQVALSARNAIGEVVDRQTRTISVPDPAGPGVWISSPAVIRTSNALELRQAQREPAVTPSASREFERNERLLIRFSVNGANAPQAAVNARLLNHRGAFLTKLPIGRRPAGTESEIDLALTSLARGDFLVSIQATHGGDLAEALVPLRILR